ncbi:MAG: DUF2262 domain-containing protein [Ruminococcus sp.]|nr:DUF2262 domain-containing protein [Ruminococcus sp.]
MEFPHIIGTGTVPERLKQYYEDYLHEYLIMIGGGSAYTSRLGGSTESNASFPVLGHIDLTDGFHRSDKGSFTWILTPEEERTKSYKGIFTEGEIYRILGYPYKGGHSFYPAKVLEGGLGNPFLEGLMEEFNRPVTMHSELFGELKLNKRYGVFYGKFNWLGTEIEVSFNTDEDDDAGCLAHLEEFCRDAERRDKEIREYAADELTYLANDWRDDDHLDEEITEEDFARRIVISNVEMSSEGDWYVWFEDGDMFAGHSVRVHGEAMGPPSYASMEG